MPKKTVVIALTDAMHIAAVLCKAADREQWNDDDAETARWMLGALLRSVKTK